MACRLLSCERFPGLKILLYLLLTIGIESFFWSFLSGIMFSMEFPYTSDICKATWLWFGASLLFMFWLPLSYWLISNDKEDPAYPIIFVIGCLICNGLSIASAVHVSSYFNEDGFAKKEYLEHLHKYIQEKSDFPTWAQGKNCCAWDGPADLGCCAFSGKDDNFASGITTCYGSNNVTIMDFGSRLTLSFLAGNNSFGNETTNGCHRHLMASINQQAEVVRSHAIILIPFQIVTVIAYLYLYFTIFYGKYKVDVLKYADDDFAFYMSLPASTTPSSARTDAAAAVVKSAARLAKKVSTGIPLKSKPNIRLNIPPPLIRLIPPSQESIGGPHPLRKEYPSDHVITPISDTDSKISVTSQMSTKERPLDYETEHGIQRSSSTPSVLPSASQHSQKSKSRNSFARYGRKFRPKK